jgi:hypothetical protein
MPAHFHMTGKMKTTTSAGSRKWVWIAILLLALGHHDFWLWGERGLVWGFLPVGMVYHMAFSLAAALFWVVVIKFAWPHELEEWAREPEQRKPGT